MIEVPSRSYISDHIIGSTVCWENQIEFKRRERKRTKIEKEGYTLILHLHRESEALYDVFMRLVLVSPFCRRSCMIYKRVTERGEE